MATDFIPRPDAQALAFMLNFASKLVEDPAKYMTSAAEAAAINNSVLAFQAALADLSDPNERNPVNTAIKDEARNAAEQLCRQYAGLIRVNAGISNPDKIAAGVRPINPNREPRPCPQTLPKLNVIAATYQTHTLKYADSLGVEEESGARPFGATELQLYVAIGTAPATDPEQARFYGKFTRNPVAVAFQAADNGKTATYWGRWAGSRGDTSPFSNPVHLGIAA